MLEYFSERKLSQESRGPGKMVVDDVRVHSGATAKVSVIPACISSVITNGQGNYISHTEELGGKLEDSEECNEAY